MFGMTGAGKSALGNLMAGCDAFASGDDTASVTNLDSVMRYEAAERLPGDFRHDWSWGY